MTERTLASAVSEAVSALLIEHREIAQDAIMEMLPAHVRSARPSVKIVKAAVIAAGWRSVKGRDDIMMFRAPQVDSDPLAKRGDNEAGEQLRLLIERIERLEEEKKGISDDVKDVYGEAKSTGFDVKTIRSIVRLRKMEKHARDEQEALLDLYKTVLGLD